MKKILTLIIVLITLTVQAQFTDLDKDLYCLPDVIFKSSKNLDGGTAYELRIKQPLDHDDESKGYIYQKAFLHHVDYDSPMVIVTEGYTCNRHRAYEVTKMLEANQLQVEHRYFGASMPAQNDDEEDTLDYQYLNLKQATADYHKIKEIFSQLYKEKWVSTGISKGGATTIFYKYFYPEDVAAGVPYVAPINDEYEEDRIYEFLDNVGTAECRAKLYDVQKNLLENRDQVLPLLKFYSKGAKVKYDYLGFEQAFEYAVLEYPFAFWQWGASCDEIPDRSASIDSVLSYFLDVSGMTFFGDGAMEDYASHYYQSAEEFGYYGYEVDDFEGLLQAIPKGQNPHATFTPNKMKVEFDPTLLNNLHKWLKKDGHHLAYIYGANDTWSASAVPENNKVDSEWFFMEGKSHGDARIKNMTTKEKARLKAALSKWLDMELKSTSEE